MKNISDEFYKNSMKGYEKCCKNKVLRHALSKSSIDSLVKSQDSTFNTNFAFSIDIKTLPCANQKNSGRCWIFAGLNVLREIIAQKCNMTNFELSQSYIAFYDKLEKINYKMESFIKLIDCNPDDRTYSFLLNSGIEDGGQWDMFVNVVKKYGLVPQNVFKETFQSSNTRQLNNLINVELRKFAAASQKLYKKYGIEKVRQLKDEMLEKFYYFLMNCYGKPVEKFDFEYVDKDGNYHCEENYTPLSFFNKFIGDEINDYISIINAPTKDKPFYETYTIDFLGNVIGGKDIIHLNLPMERFKELVLKQIENHEVVWFGCDCGKYAERDECLWDVDLFDYKTPFDLDYMTSKEEALDYHISTMDHAMVFTGVSLINGKPTKWKVENSWGQEKVNKGYYVMNDSWFDIYVYQAVVNRKYLGEKELKAYESKVNVLKPWDPMGSLAK